MHYSTTIASTKLSMNPRTVRRLCKQHGIGTEVGGIYVLTDADLEKLQEFKGREPGNPEWKKAAKTAKKKRRK